MFDCRNRSGALLLGFRSVNVLICIFPKVFMYMHHVPFSHVVSHVGLPVGASSLEAAGHFGAHCLGKNLLAHELCPIRISCAPDFCRVVFASRRAHIRHPGAFSVVGSCWISSCCRNEDAQSRKLGRIKAKHHQKNIFDHLELWTIWNCAVFAYVLMTCRVCPLPMLQLFSKSLFGLCLRESMGSSWFVRTTSPTGCDDDSR